MVVFEENIDYLINGLKQLTRFRKSEFSILNITELSETELKFEEFTIIVSSIRDSSEIFNNSNNFSSILKNSFILSSDNYGRHSLFKAVFNIKFCSITAGCNKNLTANSRAKSVQHLCAKALSSILFFYGKINNNL